MNKSLVHVKEAVAAAKNIKAVVLDGDGVIFPSQVIMGINEDGSYKVAHQRRDHKDGQGMSLVRAVEGIVFAFITAETNGFATALAGKLNKLPSVRSDANPKGWAPIDVFAGPIGKDKVGTIGNWLKEKGISWGECAYMGDDIGDYEIMGMVGLPATPADAEELVKGRALFVAARKGGEGAIRDLCNFILDAKGVDPSTLSLR